LGLGTARAIAICGYRRLIAKNRGHPCSRPKQRGACNPGNSEFRGKSKHRLSPDRAGNVHSWMRKAQRQAQVRLFVAKEY
jgi:hypothetical protein